MHPSLNRAGGAENVCLHVINALSRAGYKIKLVTIDKTDWQFLERVYGKVAMPHEQWYILERMPIRNIYHQAVFSFSFFLSEMAYVKLKSESDVIFNTSGEFIDLMADICYINAIPLRLMRLSHSNMLWRLISTAYDCCLKVFSKPLRSNILIVNSTFTRKILQQSLGCKSIVIYPPVDVKKFDTSSSREDLIVTVCRFRQGKQLEKVPRIARALKFKFLIVGIADEASESTIRFLRQEINKFDVKDRVELIINPSFKELVNIVSSAKLFLHTQDTESFGISIVEAMAAGCVPVVPRCGGPWFDILDRKQGAYGFSYSSVEEAAEIINRLLEDDGLRETVAERARKRALVFDPSVFERKILKVVNEVLRSKSGK